MDIQEEPTRKDPRGLVRNDLNLLRSVFVAKIFTPKDSLAEIMFREGIQTVLQYIEKKMVAPRENNDGLTIRQ